MAQYEENDYGKIYSDFARRLAVIARQYDKLQIEDEYKYDSTLYICILQNLLTQVDSIREWALNPRRTTAFKVEYIWDAKLPFWEINSSNIEIHREDDLRIGYVLDNIRDVLSHPLPVSSGMEYISVSELGKIVSYTFVRKDKQQNIWFQVNLSSQKVKNLVEHLSNYLSNIAKNITESAEDEENLVPVKSYD